MKIFNKGKSLLPVPPLSNKKIRCHNCGSVLDVTNDDVIESKYNDKIEVYGETKHPLFRADEEWRHTKKGFLYNIKCLACGDKIMVKDHVTTDSEFIGYWQD